MTILLAAEARIALGLADSITEQDRARAEAAFVEMTRNMTDDEDSGSHGTGGIA